MSQNFPSGENGRTFTPQLPPHIGQGCPTNHNSPTLPGECGAAPPGRRVEVESQGEGRCHQLTQRPSWLKPGVNRTWVGCAESIQHSKECSLIVCNTGSSQPAWQTNGQNTSIRTAEVEPNVKTGRCPRAYGLPGQTDEETKAQRGLWQRPARNFPFQNLQWLRRQFG